MKFLLTAGLALTLGSASAAVAQQQVSIDLAGLQIRNNTNQSRNSAPNTISPSYRYHTEIGALVHGVGGYLQVLFPNPTPLSQVLAFLGVDPGVLVNDVTNCSGLHPWGPSSYRLAGSTPISGGTLDYGFTLTTEIDAAGVAYFSLTDVVLSPSLLTGYLRFDSGSLTVTRVNFCPANCDGSTTPPVLNINDLICFLNAFAAAVATTANCDCSTTSPVLNVLDFTCFLNQFAAGCP